MITQRGDSLMTGQSPLRVGIPSVGVWSANLIWLYGCTNTTDHFICHNVRTRHRRHVVAMADAGGVFTSVNAKPKLNLTPKL